MKSVELLHGEMAKNLLRGFLVVEDAYIRACACSEVEGKLCDLTTLNLVDHWPRLRGEIAANLPHDLDWLPEALTEDLGVMAGRFNSIILAFSVTEAEKARQLPLGWIAPVAGFWESVLAKIGNENIKDSILLDTLEAAAKALPGLLDTVDVQSLADTFEAAMGQAAVNAAIKAEKVFEPRVRAFAVEYAPMAQAIDKLGAKTPVGAKLSSADWANVPLALRERAQFSAKVESVRFLSTLQDKLMKRVSLERERTVGGEAFIDRDSFIRDMRRLAQEEGLQTTDESGKGTVRDINSVQRLGLIYDQQTKSAAEFTRWKMGQDPDVLDEFPAWRFVRISDVEKIRPEHVSFENEVRLKTDLDFWMSINEDFGVPWGPWGYGCGHDVEEVDRTEAEALGLLSPGDVMVPVEKDFNDKLEASIKDWSPDEISTMKMAFGDQVEENGDRLAWQGNLISDFYDGAMTNKALKANLDLGTATPRAINLAAANDVNLDGYKLQMKADDIRHAENRHGLASGDRNPIDRLDIELVPHVWRDPDEVTMGSKGALRFKKLVDGRLVFVEFERSEKNKLAGIKSVHRETE